MRPTRSTVGPVVEERRRLLPRRRDLPRRQRRRVRRLPRPDPADRPPGRLGVTCIWLMPFYPTAGPRRRLRHHRLLRRRPAAGHARRLRRVHPHRPRPRHAGDRRPRGQPHLATSTRGSSRPAAAATRRYRDWYVWRDEDPPTQPERRRVPRPGDQHLGARRADRPVLPAPASTAPARPERRQPRGARRDRQDHRLLDGAGPVRIPGGRGAVPHRDQRAAGRRRPARPARLPRATCARSCSRRSGRRRAARRGQPAPPGPEQSFGSATGRRRRADHVFDFIGMQAHVPRAGPPGRRAARSTRSSSGPSRPRTGSGRSSCATTTSSPWTSSATPSARRSSPPSGPSQDMQLYGRGSAGACRRCSTATRAGSGWSTACSSRCRARRCCSTARRSAWART